MPPSPSSPQARPLEPRHHPAGALRFWPPWRAGGSVPISTMLLLKAGWGPTVPIAVAGELHPVPRHWAAQGQVGCGGQRTKARPLRSLAPTIWRGLRSLRRGALRIPIPCAPNGRTPP